MFVSFSTPQRLLDGSPDPQATIPANHYRVRCSGLVPWSVLTATVIYGDTQWPLSEHADGLGVIDVVREVTDPQAFAILDQIGGFATDRMPSSISANGVTIDLDVG
jgi:hypothetical protein